MGMVQIKQGDAYELPIDLTFNSKVLEGGVISTIELYFGTIRKMWPGDMTYSGGVLYLPLTQEDTFSFNSGDYVPIDIRIKFKSGDVYGLTPKIVASIVDSVSREVL